MRPLMPALAAGLALLVSACATTSAAPPRQTGDACTILKEKRPWRAGLRKSANEWDVTPGLILAFIAQESGFRADAKPPRKDGFLFVPGKRPSTAEGYAQALDGTWDDYRKATGRNGAKRSNFNDAAHFVGWYVDRSHRMAAIPKNDARAQYLAYHEGPTGYKRGMWRKKAWLINVADKVSTNTARYDAQLAACDGVRLASAGS